MEAQFWCHPKHPANHFRSIINDYNGVTGPHPNGNPPIGEARCRGPAPVHHVCAAAGARGFHHCFTSAWRPGWGGVGEFFGDGPIVMVLVHSFCVSKLGPQTKQGFLCECTNLRNFSWGQQFWETPSDDLQSFPRCWCWNMACWCLLHILQLFKYLPNLPTNAGHEVPRTCTQNYISGGHSKYFQPKFDNNLLTSSWFP